MAKIIEQLAAQDDKAKEVHRSEIEAALKPGGLLDDKNKIQLLVKELQEEEHELEGELKFTLSAYLNGLGADALKKLYANEGSEEEKTLLQFAAKVVRDHELGVDGQIGEKSRTYVLLLYYYHGVVWGLYKKSDEEKKRIVTDFGGLVGGYVKRGLPLHEIPGYEYIIGNVVNKNEKAMTFYKVYINSAVKTHDEEVKMVKIDQEAQRLEKEIEQIELQVSKIDNNLEDTKEYIRKKQTELAQNVMNSNADYLFSYLHAISGQLDYGFRYPLGLVDGDYYKKEGYDRFL